MKMRFKYTTTRIAFIILFSLQLFNSSCSTHKISTKTNNTDLQPNGKGDVIATQPLIDNVEIPSDFFEDIFPNYTRGITVVLTINNDTKTLTPLQQAEINELFKQSKASGALHEIHILAWGSDKNNLARSAALNIEKVRTVAVPHLDRPTSLVTAYNMDIVPSWASRLLMSKEARIRAHFTRIDKTKMFSKVIIGVSTTDQKNFMHPDMISL